MPPEQTSITFHGTIPVVVHRVWGPPLKIEPGATVQVDAATARILVERDPKIWTLALEAEAEE